MLTLKELQLVLDASVKFLTRTMDLCQSVNGKQTFKGVS